MYKTEIDGKISYEYEVVEDQVAVPVSDQVVYIKGYGVKVKAVDQTGREWSEVYEKITPYREKAEELSKSFAENALSPLHLYDVVENIIEDYITDFDVLAYKNAKLAI